MNEIPPPSPAMTSGNEPPQLEKIGYVSSAAQTVNQRLHRESTVLHEYLTALMQGFAVNTQKELQTLIRKALEEILERSNAPAPSPEQTFIDNDPRMKRIRMIIAAYEQCDGNSVRAERQTGCRATKIRKIWRQAGLRIHGRGER